MRGGHTGRGPLGAVAVLIGLLVLVEGGTFGESDPSEEGADAGQQIVVTATRVETPAEQVGSSMTVISRLEIEESGQEFVGDLLRHVPGLDVVRGGGPGQTTSVFIRGAKSEQTLVLIDGIEANDPISPGRGFDFAHLSTDNVERIEVIRGPQSTLYGSDAMGGVINIITRKGTGRPHGSVGAEVGSFDTYRESVELSGSTDMLGYALSLSRYDTNGISAADEDAGNDEDDGYENTTFSGRFTFSPADEFDLDLVLRYTDAESELDNFGGAFGDDPNYLLDTEELFARLQGRLRLLDGRWEQKLGVAFTDYDRRADNDVDPAHPSDLVRSKYLGEILKFDWQHDFHLSESNTLTLGFETEEEKGRSRYYSESMFGPYLSVQEEREARTNSAYVQDQWEVIDNLFATLGARVDDHDRFGSETTYRAALAYQIEATGTRLKASYGTGFKAPTLFQLFSDYGNPNLEPEESTGWDLGVEQSLMGDRLTLGATYFKNDFDDLIDYVPTGFTGTYMNVDRAESDGVEVSVKFQATESLSLRANCTHQDTEDRETGRDLLRRPHRKAGIGATYRFPSDRARVGLDVLYVGSRDDLDFSSWPAERVELSSYTLVNLSGSYDVSKCVRLFGRIENLLDDDYQEVRGFGAPGIGFYGGMRLTF